MLQIVVELNLKYRYVTAYTLLNKVDFVLAKSYFHIDKEKSKMKIY